MVAHVRPLGRRQVAVHVALDLDLAAVQNPLPGETLAHHAVDLGTDEVGGCEDRRARAPFPAEREPEPGRLRPQLLVRHFAHFELPRSLRRPAPLQGLHGTPEARIALAQDLVHLCHGDASILQGAERLARTGRAQLAAVADQNQPGCAQALRDPHQELHLRRGSHRRLVQHQYRALVLAPCTGHLLRVADVAVARQEPLQRACARAGLVRQHPGRGGRRREQDRLPLAHQTQRLAQHRRLARPRCALHRDDPVARQQHRAHRLPLPLGEGRLFHPMRYARVFSQRLRSADPIAHAGHDLALGPQRLARHEGASAPNPGLHQVAVGQQSRHRRVDLLKLVPARRVAQRDRPDVALPQYRRALREVLHRPPDDLAGAEPRRLGMQLLFRPYVGPAPGSLARLVPVLRANLPGEAAVVGNPLRPPLPFRLQRVDILVGLVLPGDQRRLLRQRRAVRKTVRVQPGQDLAAPRRERVQQRARVARDLKARNPADHRRLDAPAQREQPSRQLLAVIGTDQLHVAADLGGLHAPPLTGPVARHVGEDAVRVQLRVLVPARQVPEPRRHQAVRRHPGAPPRRRIVAARLQKLGLDPVQRRPHRRVVGAQHLAVAVEQRLQRYRLRRRQREVEPRTVLVLPAARPAEPDLRPRHVAGKNALEKPGRDLLRQAQRRSPLAVPEARAPVPAVVLRVVALALEIRDRHGGRAEIAQARDHAPRSPAARAAASAAPITDAGRRSCT